MDIMRINNVPDYADEYNYIVARICDRELWFYGAYDDKATADRARDEVNAVSAVHSLKGSVQRILDPLTESLTQIIAQIEVNIYYPEYDDVEQLRDEQILPQAEEWLKMIR